MTDPSPTAELILCPKGHAPTLHRSDHPTAGIEFGYACPCDTGVALFRTEDEARKAWNECHGAGRAMTDPELVEQIATTLAVAMNGKVCKWGMWLHEARALLPLIASREAAAADKRQAEIVAYLRGLGWGEFNVPATAIESGSFRTGEG